MACSAKPFKKKKKRIAVEYTLCKAQVVATAACIIPASSLGSLLKTRRKTSLQIALSGKTPPCAGDTRLPSHQACFVFVKLT